MYRTLQLYADQGDVDVLRREDGEAIYRRCSETHHHHLVCRSCGATVEVEGPAVERWTTVHGRRARLHRRQPHPGDLRYLRRLLLSAAAWIVQSVSVRRNGSYDHGNGLDYRDRHAFPYLRSRWA